MSSKEEDFKEQKNSVLKTPAGGTSETPEEVECFTIDINALPTQIQDVEIPTTPIFNVLKKIDVDNKDKIIEDAELSLKKEVDKYLNKDLGKKIIENKINDGIEQIKETNVGKGANAVLNYLMSQENKIKNIIKKEKSPSNNSNTQLPESDPDEVPASGSSNRDIGSRNKFKLMSSSSQESGSGTDKQRVRKTDRKVLFS